ncbi:hypothetical protein ABZW11_26455 [Nonomuraea sp. NPDC004580]|uniref:hypothetical protein n=1 Tax=Nonomuraea sp. NPDC004580 TaxID=3154552 RepID=UPI0033AA6D0D
MTAWTRRQLHTALTDTRAENAKLRDQLADLAKRNNTLTQQLADARTITNALRADNQQLRDQLDTIRRDPLHDQLRAAQRHAAALEQRLDEMTCKSRTLDTTPQGWSTR